MLEDLALSFRGAAKAANPELIGEIRRARPPSDCH